MSKRSKKRRLPDFVPEDVCKVNELVSLPIARELLFGSREKALELYKKDAKEIRRLIEAIAGTDMKIFSFEDLDVIGGCRGHPWGHVAAASVTNYTQGKRCILVATFNGEECSAHHAIKSVAPRANWKVVKDIF